MIQLQVRQTLGFMEIPAELRLIVYQYLLRSERPFELWPGLYEADATWSHYASFKFVLPVLRLSKNIHSEAAPVFYGENEFRFSGADAYLVCKSFFMTIGDSNVRFLRKLTLPIPTILGAECASWGVDDIERDISHRIERCGMVRPYQNISFSDSLDAVDSIIKTLHQLAKDDVGIALKELQLIVPCTLYYFRDQEHENERLCRDVNCLKGSNKDLRISLVLHHHGFFRKMKQVYGHADDFDYDGTPIQDQCRSGRADRAWLLNVATDMDWSLRECYGLDDEHGGYQVVDAGSIVDDTVTGWTVSEPGPDSGAD